MHQVLRYAPHQDVLEEKIQWFLKFSDFALLPFRVRLGPPWGRIWGPFGVHLGLLWGPLRLHLPLWSSLWSPFGIRSGTIRDPFGIHSGSVPTHFGPKSSEPKIQNFQFVRPSPFMAAVPSPAARRAPAAAAMAAQIENFRENFQRKQYLAIEY